MWCHINGLYNYYFLTGVIYKTSYLDIQLYLFINVLLRPIRPIYYSRTRTFGNALWSIQGRPLEEVPYKARLERWPLALITRISWFNT